MIQNEYIESEKHIILKIINKKGKCYECFIDVEDRNVIKQYKWHIAKDKRTHLFYARATLYLGMENGKPKYKSLLLHSLIMNCFNHPYEIVVDHKNHNTLDNRKENLRVIKYQDNTKHRSSRNSNNTSGYRNVSKIGKWWCVQLQINDKNTLLKKFPLDKLDEAGAYAKEMREKYYGDFAGEN